MQALFRPNLVPPENDPNVAARLRCPKITLQARCHSVTSAAPLQISHPLFRIGTIILASEALLASGGETKSRNDFSGGENFADKADAA